MYGEEERIQTIRKKEKEMYEEQAKSLVNKQERELEKEKEKYEEKLEEMQRRHNNELKTFKDKLKIE